MVQVQKAYSELEKHRVYLFQGTKKGVVPPGGLRIGEEQVRRVEEARFLKMWVDWGVGMDGPYRLSGSQGGAVGGCIGRGFGINRGRSLDWFCLICSTVPCHSELVIRAEWPSRQNIISSK